MRTKFCLKYLVNGCLWKQLLVSKWSQTSSNLICLSIFITLRPLKLFWTKIRATNLEKKMIKFVFLENYFPSLFTELQIWYWKSFKFVLGGFFRNIKEILAEVWLFLAIKIVKKIKSKWNFSDNHVHNILRLFDGWENFPATTSETKLDY